MPKEGIVLLFIFLTIFAGYAYFIHFIGLESWNASSRFNLTYALAEQGSFRIDAYHQNTGDKVYYRGHYYSDKAPGPSLLAVPFYFLLKRVGVNTEKFMRYGITLMVIGLPSALASLLFYQILKMLGGISPSARVVLTLSWALGTLAFPFSTVFYGHQMAAALSVAAFFILLRIKSGFWPERGSTLWLAGIVSGWAFLSDYPSGISMLLIGIYCLVIIKKKSKILCWMLGVAFPVAFLLYYNAACFGRVWSSAYSFHITYSHQSGFLGVGWPRLRALWGITFSPYRGIFYQSPFLLFAFPGAFFLSRRRELRKEWFLCLALVLGFMVFNSGYAYWDGVGSVGARFLIPSLPFLVILISGAIEKWPRPVVALVIFSVILMLVVVATEPRVEWKVSSPLLYFNFFLLFRGDLSENLGMLLGMKWWGSLIPLILLLLLFIILIFRFLPFTMRLGWDKRQLRNTSGILCIVVLWFLLAGWEEPYLREFDKAESLFRYYRSRGLVDWQELEGRYRKAIDLEPRFIEPYLRLAEIARLKGKPRLALAYYNELLQMKVQPVLLRREMALLFEMLGEKEQAEAVLGEAVTIAPDNASLRNQLAEFYWRSGRRKEAIFQWEESLRLNPKDRRVSLRLESTREK